MPPAVEQFQPINRAFANVFRPGQMSIGLVLPLLSSVDGEKADAYPHLERVQMIEKLGFTSLWIRDIPFNDPEFGDVGQIYDPFVYLGLLAGATDQIALGAASIILPLRHPAHAAKAAASVDQLSDGRLLLGIASGDRPAEYPAMNIDFDGRGAAFRDSVEYMRATAENFPTAENSFGSLQGAIDLLPKPTGSRLPMLVTGGSQQTHEWAALHGDAWMMYPRGVDYQAMLVNHWRENVAAADLPPKPTMQSFGIDLLADDNAEPERIHLGIRSGMPALIDTLRAYRDIGINHVALNLRQNHADLTETLHRLAAELLPVFHEEQSDQT